MKHTFLLVSVLLCCLHLQAQSSPAAGSSSTYAAVLDSLKSRIRTLESAYEYTSLLNDLRFFSGAQERERVDCKMELLRIMDNFSSGSMKKENYETVKNTQGLRKVIFQQGEAYLNTCLSQFDRYKEKYADDAFNIMRLEQELTNARKAREDLENMIGIFDGFIEDIRPAVK